MKKLLICILASIVVISTVGCSNNKSLSKDVSLQNILDKGTLTLGTSADYAPYEFHAINENGEDEIMGFDISIAKEIANQLGVELKILDMNFDGLLSSLNSNQVDIVIAGMGPTPERVEAVDFTDVYYNSQQTIIVRKNDVEKYTNFESFEGKKVGAQRGSIQEKMVNSTMETANLVSLTKLGNLILELKNGTIDGAVVEKPVAEGYIKRYPDLAFSNISVEESTDGSAIALKKGSDELVNKLNEIIDNLKNSGKIDEFVVEANEYSHNQSE